MEYGCVVLANSKKGFVPQAIKWFTGSTFSHSLITMPQILEVDMCVEAGTTGVDMARFDTQYADDPNQGYEIWKLKIPTAVKENALKGLLYDLELFYGYTQYFYFIWRRINLWLGRDIKNQNNWMSKQGMICSQLCVAYSVGCGLGKLLNGYGSGSIAPQDLRDVFVSNPRWFELIESVRMDIPKSA